AGLGLSILLLICMWALMTYTALITLEMNLYFNRGVSIAYAAEYSLGRIGKVVSTFTIAMLFYALLSAYMAGGSSVLDQLVDSLFGIKISSTVSVVLFASIFGSIILARTHFVDKANRWLLFVKTSFFIIIVAVCLPKIDISFLGHTPTECIPYFSILIPLFFTSFGFHGSIPTIVNYIGSDPQKLRSTFILGSTIPLIVYIVWEVVVLGVIPLEGVNSFAYIKANGGDLGLFSNTLSTLAGGGWIVSAAQGFTSLAVATSFLGVGLGLFDFMEEQLTRNEKRPPIFITGSFTFIVPLVFALFYPEGFVVALGYAAIALSILAIIIPVLVVWKLRKTQTSKAQPIWGGRLGLILALVCGLWVIVLEVKTILM
ncbi:MAG: aromatic amino acid transport family protein, partial [Alphaproteobacteria bacterium]|nr:aromatic amino acid transport family protein [Alphaproteobacteria bacterium]